MTISWIFIVSKVALDERVAIPPMATLIVVEIHDGTYYTIILTC
jgi:uncharacterized lipoprotein YbaY